MFLGDFHIHSQYSDGKLTIPQLVDTYGRHNFGAIAITDHLCEEKTFLGKTARYLEKTLRRENFDQYIQDIRKEVARASQLYNMAVIPGVEITKNSFSHTDSAHIVALGIHSYIDPNQSVIDVIADIHAQGGIAIAAHPVSTRKMEPQTLHLWNRRDELSNSMDAWEVASGSVLFEEVFESGLPMIANSDLHRPQQISSWKTVLSCRREQASVLASIKNQDLDFTYFSVKSPLINRRFLQSYAKFSLQQA